MIKNMRNKNIYHGSFCIVESPAADMGRNGKDFGKGFYTTTDKLQAVSFAKLKAKREQRSVS